MVHYYDYIYITETGASASGKTKIFTVCNMRSNDVLGVIKWHGPWRQYVFFPEAGTLFSSGCLKDIREFIDGRVRLA